MNRWWTQATSVRFCAYCGKRLPFMGRHSKFCDLRCRQGYRRNILKLGIDISKQ